MGGATMTRFGKLGKRVLAVPLTVLLFLTAACGSSSPASSQETRDSADFHIAQYKSAMDRDGDGVDDQTDFLTGVRNYLKTKPQYKSEYVAGGYPNDGYGVCTDVVAFGALAAGYDLRQLVSEDIASDPAAYDVQVPDMDIDFRRVPNLNVYFSRHAETLTTDVRDIDQWQGGDIVVFANHIGVVSDKRNQDGVPYVLHHQRANQKNYEEDILETRNDLVAHYRLS